MLKEPFWLGLITVCAVLSFIGFVWCAKRHFPEKIEKLLVENSDSNRRKYSPSHLFYNIEFRLLPVDFTCVCVCARVGILPNAKEIFVRNLGVSEVRKISFWNINDFMNKFSY